MMTRRSVLRSLPALAALPQLASAEPRPTRLLIGTGTGGKSTSKGIYLTDWNSTTGALGEFTLAATIESPTFLALSPRAPSLYAITEGKDGKVTSFHLTSLGLDRINEQTSAGSGPAHVAVNVDGRSAFVANYGGGSLTSYALDPTGALSAPVSHFQYEPVDADPAHKHSHAHEATPSPDGKWLLVNDLGEDLIRIYRIDPATATLTPAAPAFWQGRLKSGPRHLCFHPNGRWVYNVNELDSTVDHLTWDARRGALTTATPFISTLPPNYPRDTAFASEILASRDGRFVYAGNRRSETIATLNLDPRTGAPTLQPLTAHGGRTARHIALDPTERFLLVALQDSNGIAVLPRDPATGKLSEPIHTYPIDSPQCLIFTP